MSSYTIEQMISMDNFPFYTRCNYISAPSQVLSTRDDLLENDYPIVDEREFCRALDRCYTQSQNGNVCKLNFSKIPARNAFENLLREMGVEMCTSGDDEISVYLGLI